MVVRTAIGAAARTESARPWISFPHSISFHLLPLLYNLPGIIIDFERSSSPLNALRPQKIPSLCVTKPSAHLHVLPALLAITHLTVHHGPIIVGICILAIQLNRTREVFISLLVVTHFGIRESAAIDAYAPFFKIASYGIVGDYNQVVPILIEEFKKRLSR